MMEEGRREERGRGFEKLDNYGDKILVRLFSQMYADGKEVESVCVYIYIYMCVCVCKRGGGSLTSLSH